MTSGQTLYYENDVFGRRTSTSDASGDYNSYYYGAGGNTEAVCLYPYSANLTYNIFGAGGDNIGQVKVANGSVSGRYYYLKDHLGSIRMTVDVNGNPVGWDDYYPYGMQMTGRSYTSSADQRYKFTGKELDAPDGLYYFGKRYYDSFRGQWLEVDPLYSKYPGTSPYDYVLSNPIRLVDPDGSVTYMIDGVEVDQGLGQQLAEQYQQQTIFQNNSDNNNNNNNNKHKITKTENNTIWSLSTGAILTIGGGLNFSLGISGNLDNKAFIYLKWGTSIGFEGSAGGELTVTHGQTLYQTLVEANNIDPAINPIEINGGYGPFNPIILLSSRNNGYKFEGNGWGVGPAIGLSANSTWQSITTPIFDLFNSLIMPGIFDKP